jgi:hypothetical protein
VKNLGSTIISFLTLGIAVSTIQCNGDVVDYATLIAFLENPTFNSPPSFNTLTGPLTVSQTNASATPGSVRDVYGQIVTGVSMTSGTLAGVRGEADITNATLFGNGGSAYLYGTQGKVIGGTGTINVGSGYVTGVLGQLDLTGTTNTSGHIAGVISSIQGVGSSGVDVNLFYGESATGTPINSMFMGFGKSTYVFDLASNTYNQMATTSGSVTNVGTKGWLKCNIEGVTRYIALGDGVT